MSESITNLPDAVAALGALPLPVGPEPQALSEADELAAFRALELGDPDGRVSAACGNPSHPTWLRAKIDPRGCPWCEIDQAHEDVVGANLARWEEEQENARLRLALASAQRGRRGLRSDLQFAEGSRQRWRTATIEAERERDQLKARVAELEAERHVTNEALDDAVQELRAKEAPLKGRARLDAAAAAAAEVTHWRRLGITEPEGEFHGSLHHSYRLGHDLPETGGTQC